VQRGEYGEGSGQREQNRQNPVIRQTVTGEPAEQDEGVVES
jgi:hypothetical protein